MYFFDLEDYVDGKVIGCDNQDTRLVGDWNYLDSIARQTSNAFLKSFNEWYIATRQNMPNGDCTELDLYYNDIVNYKDDSRYDAFWNNVSTSLTRDIWDDYLALMGETMCKFQELLRYLDGDTFEAYNP